MVKRFFILALCAGLLVPGGSALAQQGPASGNEDKIATVDQKLSEELGTSPEQQQKMKELRKGFQERQKMFNEELRSKRAALFDALESEGAVDRNKVDGLVAEIKSLQGKLLDNIVERTIKDREVLTPEQYQKFKEIHKKRQAEESMRGLRGRMLDQKVERNY